MASVPLTACLKGKGKMVVTHVLSEGPILHSLMVIILNLTSGILSKHSNTRLFGNFSQMAPFCLVWGV